VNNLIFQLQECAKNYEISISFFFMGILTPSDA
jgi:hypothetical protein